MKPNYRNAEFILSAAKPAQFPPDEGAEVAFVGRSNSGKSSSLNTLTGKKTLAKTSKTPGRTQLINFFDLSENQRLVDLPGYGYAKAPIAIQKKWIELVNRYLNQRQSLKGLVVLMDIRHAFTSLDQQLLLWANERALPIHILLNKADKLSFSQQKNTLLASQAFLTQYQTASIQLFSSLRKIGLDELRSVLDHWLNPG